MQLKAKVLALHDAGLDVAEIAPKLKVGQPYVRATLYRAGRGSAVSKKRKNRLSALAEILAHGRWRAMSIATQKATVFCQELKDAGYRVRR
jgi:hypothetical protein